MARVNVNNFGLRYAPESTLGTKPTSGWRELEPNNPATFGATISTAERRPISPDRGRKKGTVVNLESAVEVEADLTMDAFTDFAEGFVFAEFANKEFDLKSSSGTLPPPAVDGGGSNDSFTIDAASALLGGKMVYNASGAISLVYAKGYTNSENNGLHALAADVASTDTAVEVATGTLVAETPSTNASLQVAGVRVTDADLTLTVSGSTATLVSGGDITDWSTLGLFAGMYIHIGSADANGNPVNALNVSAEDDTYGYARITSISGATLNLDKLDVYLAATASHSGDGVCDIMFGRFLRNVATTSSSNDEEYLERSYSFEGLYPDLGGVGTDEYEYAVGNFANELAINLPLTDKATATWGFIGTNTEDITGTRTTGPSTAVSPLRTEAINTSAGFASISTDVISAASDVCFKSLTVTLNNNASPENCLGTLGASYINSGLFEVNVEGQMLFTNKAITNAIKNNTTVTMAFILKNEDGAIAFDIPSLTFGGGEREFPQDASVLVNVTGIAFNDPSGTIPNVSLGITLFPTVPTVRGS